MRRTALSLFQALLTGTVLAAAPALPSAASEAPARKPAMPSPIRVAQAMEPAGAGEPGAGHAVANAPALPRDSDTALLALDRRARAGDLDAQVALAEHFAAGIRPDPADVRRAFFWYGQAAERGDADAAWALAGMFRHRDELMEGAKPDMAEAVRLYRQAADLGHAEAMFEVGLLFTNGTGLPLDTEQAVHWFERAADAGIARALFMLGILYEQGVDGAPDAETAAAWYALAAEGGDATAQEALKRLADGRGNVLVAELPGSGTTQSTPQAQARTAPTAGAQVATAPRPTPGRAVPVNQAGVREIQQLLTRMGYKPGKADGQLGKRTAAAIRAYQKTEGLTVDGRATQALLDHLRRRARA